MKIPLVLLACVVTQVHGQQMSSALSSIRVTGAATVVAKPERAQINVGVLTQEKQATVAATQNSRQLDAVQSALHKVLGPDADIRTVNFTINPDYQYRPIGKPAIGSYTALSVVRVTTDELDKVGAAIDAATQAGANHVQSVQYTVRDAQALHTQLLRDASAKARANAEALAAGLNLKIVRLVSAEEIRDAASAAPDMPDPESRAGPIDPTAGQSGTLEQTVNVTLTVEVGTR
jgi:uncharacterized protein